MHALRTSLLINSLIGDASLDRPNSGTIERKTRRTTPQQRVSRMRIACVQKSRKGSRIAGDVRQNCLIEGQVGTGSVDSPGGW